MDKLLILLILLSCSCTKDKFTSTIQTNNIKSEQSCYHSNQLANLLKVNNYVEDQKAQNIYKSVIKCICPGMSNDSLKKVLRTIHYWDQVYRDSLNSKDKRISNEIKIKKYWENITSLDKMNQKIVVHLLNKIGGWPDTKDMGKDASMAIWLVIHHNYGTKEFSQQILPYLNKAYFTDSVINNTMYADLYDRVNYTLNGYSKYGTYGFHEDYYHDSVKVRVNQERLKIDLDKL